MRLSLVMFLFLANFVSAQTMYKCEAGGKVEYSDKPCFNGNEVKRIAPDGGPTREDRSRAQMLQDSERARFEAQDHANADLPGRPLAAGAGEPAQAKPDATAAIAPKVLIHTKDGWDRKPQAQIDAEQRARQQGVAAARNGDPVPTVAGGQSSDPADWTSEKILKHTPQGWTQTTRGAEVQSQAVNGYEQERARSARTLVDQQGRVYTGPGGPGTYMRNDGRTCNYDGAMLHCD